MARLLLVFGFIFLLTTNIAKAQPCNGAPAAGIIYNGTTLNYCLSNQHALWFYVAGFTQNAGITLQWEMSPLGSVAWTAIPGATTDTLNGAGLLYAGGLLRVAVTCSTATSYTPLFTIPPPGTNCQDSVWPGDVNYDLVVNNMDALDLALDYGNQGYTRSGASNAWSAQFSKDWWPYLITTGVNDKNSDCNGDGIVDINDTLAIYNNYGLVHLKQAPHSPQLKTTTDPDLYFDFTGVSIVAGSTISVPIKLGNATYPMNGIYGLAASIKLDGITLSAPMTVSYNTSWLGNAAGTLRFGKAVNNNQLDWAYARTDKQNISGDGTIANVTFTIPAASTGQGILYFDNVKMINSTGAPITAYNVVDDTLNIIPLGISNTIFGGANMSVVPNPSATSAKIQFSLSRAELVKVEVINVVGERVWRTTAAAGAGAQSLDLPTSLAPGVYMIKVSSTSSSAAVKWIKE